MLGMILQPVYAFTKLLATGDSPRQVAAGFVLGMLIGLIPKGNLTALLLSTLLLMLNVNLAAGIIAAVLFSCIGPAIDPFAHRLGWSLLGKASLNSFWTWLFHIPGMAWTRLNNTVVLGNLLIGAWAAWPVYRLALPGATWLLPRWRRLLGRLRLLPVVRVLAAPRMGGQ